VRCLPLMAAGLLLALSASARADDSPYRLNTAGDATAIAASAALWWGPMPFGSSLVRTDACPCQAASLNPLDRANAGVDRRGWSLASDFASAAVIGWALLADVIDVHAAGEPAASLLTDVVVIGEAVLVNGALNELTKIAVARPRPLLYGKAGDDALLREPDNYLSFYSAHTSGAFAVGLAYAQTYAYRHPESPWRALVYAGAIAAGSCIGAARVASGRHFITDVLAGAAVGSAIGLIVPWLHLHASPVQLAVQLAPNRFELALALRST
jgi:membrane-associated phospholipid phosphatase